MAAKFGLDDGSCANFDATLVLASMLASQLHNGTSAEPQPAEARADGRSKGNTSEHPSDHTRIWSELTGNWLIL